MTTKSYLKSYKMGYCTDLTDKWIVERTFSWFENFRRLSKDYEVLTETSQAMIYLAMIQIMLNRIK
ncbi:transposase [uncultured Bacteroides sp.]|uniref:transposase n=1 Tax=uncultured Bacteroides sp. TaxID=162156 RepID=UPI0025991F89|nr:transposase [uncultured Bacteroides sp.]